MAARRRPQPTGGTSRLVDPSTTRVEVRVTGPSERVGRVSVGVRDGENVFRAPTTYVDDGQRSTVVVGVRFRAFVPNLGLHPSLPAQDPIELVVSVGERHYALALHAWIPGGGVYRGCRKTTPRPPSAGSIASCCARHR
ncbi:MAG: transglutaminase family protein [Sandaracinus sp.]|nr:transglutaminase family protein [Sandaracinus sp.]